MGVELVTEEREGPACDGDLYFEDGSDGKDDEGSMFD